MKALSSEKQIKTLSGVTQAIILALGVYLLWTVGTYLLEGRINLMHNPTPAGRAIYVLIANVVIGIGLAVWALRTFVVSNVANAKQLGFRYHYAHSAPFNQTWMVFFLMIPGLVTSLVYFLGRDLYAAIVFHNFLGMTGVIQNVDLEWFSQPLYHLYILMIISVVVLIAADVFFIRRLTDDAGTL